MIAIFVILRFRENAPRIGLHSPLGSDLLHTVQDEILFKEAGAVTDCLFELGQVAHLHCDDDLQAALASASLLTKLGEASVALLVNVDGDDHFLAVVTRNDVESVSVGQGSEATDTESANASVVVALGGATVLGVKTKEVFLRQARAEITDLENRVLEARASDLDGPIRARVGVKCIGNGLTNRSQNRLGVIVAEERGDVAHLLRIDGSDFRLEVAGFNNVALDGLNNHWSNLMSRVSLIPRLPSSGLFNFF